MASRKGAPPRRGPIDVLEAAYDLEPERVTWLRNVVEQAAAIMPTNVGLTGQFVYAPGPDVECLVASRAARFRAEDAFAILQLVPRDLHRKLHLGQAVATTISEAFPRTGFASQSLDAFFAMLVPPKFPDPIRDFLGVLAFDAEGRGVVLSAACSRRTTLDRGLRRRLTLVGVHIAAAARLRRSLEASATEPAAILRADGRVVHAEEGAKSKATLDALSGRAVAVDRARGRMRRADPDAALEMWRGLVSGRSSIASSPTGAATSWLTSTSRCRPACSH